MVRRTTAIARRLRRNATEMERLLWRHLRDGRFHGAKFRRQLPVGPYIVDFACFDRRVVVELDGGQHADNPRDLVRQHEIEALGFRVLRFWNNQVHENIEGVLDVIANALAKN